MPPAHSNTTADQPTNDAAPNAHAAAPGLGYSFDQSLRISDAPTPLLFPIWFRALGAAVVLILLVANAAATSLVEGFPQTTTDHLLVVAQKLNVLLWTAAALLFAGRLVFFLPLLSRALPEAATPRLVYCACVGWYAIAGLKMLLLAASAPAMQQAMFAIECALQAAGVVSIFALLALGPARCKELVTRKPQPPADHSDRPAANASWRTRVLCLAGLLLFALWIAPYLAQALLPHSDWDSLTYHIPMISWLREHGTWHVDPALFAFTSPASAHLLYDFGVGSKLPDATLLLNLLTSLTVVAAVFASAREHWGTPAGVIAAFVMASTNLLWELGIDARVDQFQALAIVVAADAMLRYARDADRPGALIVAAMMFNLGMGVKYTTAPAAMAAALAALVLIAMRWRMPEAQIKKTLVVAAVCIIFPSSFWYLRNYAATGDPLYPMIVGQQYQTSSGELKPVVEPAYRALAADEIKLAKSRATLLNWWSMITREHHHARRLLHRVSPALLLFFILPLLWYRDPRAWLLFALGLSLYLVIAPQTYLVRYLLPALPILAIGAGVVLSRIRFLPWTIIVCVALSLLIARDWRDELAKADEAQAAAYLAGKFKNETTWQCLTGRERSGCWTEFLNARLSYGALPEDTKVLMVCESRTAYLLAAHRADQSYVGITWAKYLDETGGQPSAMLAALKRDGYTHVIFNESQMEWIRRFAPANFEQLKPVLAHLAPFTKQLCKEIYFGEQDYVRVFELPDSIDRPIDAQPNDDSADEAAAEAKAFNQDGQD